MSRGLTLREKLLRFVAKNNMEMRIFPSYNALPEKGSPAAAAKPPPLPLSPGKPEDVLAGPPRLSRRPEPRGWLCVWAYPAALDWVIHWKGAIQ